MYSMEKDAEHISAPDTKTELRRRLGRRSTMPELDFSGPMGLGNLNSDEMPDGTIRYYDAAPIPK